MSNKSTTVREIMQGLIEEPLRGDKFHCFIRDNEDNRRPMVGTLHNDSIAHILICKGNGFHYAILETSQMSMLEKTLFACEAIDHAIKPELFIAAVHEMFNYNKDNKSCYSYVFGKMAPIMNDPSISSEKAMKEFETVLAELQANYAPRKKESIADDIFDRLFKDISKYMQGSGEHHINLVDVYAELPMPLRSHLETWYTENKNRMAITVIHSDYEQIGHPANVLRALRLSVDSDTVSGDLDMRIRKYFQYVEDTEGAMVDIPILHALIQDWNSEVKDNAKNNATIN